MRFDSMLSAIAQKATDIVAAFLRLGLMRLVLHQAPDGADGGEATPLQPCFEIGDEGAQMFGSVAQQRRRGHDGVGSGQQVFDDFIRCLDAGVGRKTRARQPTAKQGNPQQAKADFIGRLSVTSLFQLSRARSMSGW